MRNAATETTNNIRSCSNLESNRPFLNMSNVRNQFKHRRDLLFLCLMLNHRNHCIWSLKCYHKSQGSLHFSLNFLLSMFQGLHVSGMNCWARKNRIFIIKHIEWKRKTTSFWRKCWRSLVNESNRWCRSNIVEKALHQHINLNI